MLNSFLSPALIYSLSNPATPIYIKVYFWPFCLVDCTANAVFIAFVDSAGTQWKRHQTPVLREASSRIFFCGSRRSPGHGEGLMTVSNAVTKNRQRTDAARPLPQGIWAAANAMPHPGKRQLTSAAAKTACLNAKRPRSAELHREIPTYQCRSPLPAMFCASIHICGVVTILILHQHDRQDLSRAFLLLRYRYQLPMVKRSGNQEIFGGIAGPSEPSRFSGLISLYLPAWKPRSMRVFATSSR